MADGSAEIASTPLGPLYQSPFLIPVLCTARNDNGTECILAVQNELPPYPRIGIYVIKVGFIKWRLSFFSAVVAVAATGESPAEQSLNI